MLLEKLITTSNVEDSNAKLKIFCFFPKIQINNLQYWGIMYNFVTANAVIAQLVEHQLPKLRVTSSSLAYRSINPSC